MTFHCFSKEFQCCLAITALCDKAFQDFPFVIHSPPKIVRLAVDLHEYLIQMPLPVCPRPHSINPSAANFSGKQRAKSVPPKANGLMADVDAAFVQKILNIAKRKRKPNIHHDGQTDDLWARLEVAKGAAFCHPATLIARPARLNKFSSDSAVHGHSLFTTATMRLLTTLPSRCALFGKCAWPLMKIL